MAFNVTSFRSQLTQDGARPNLFDVSLQFPSFVSLGGQAAAKAVFQCKAAQLPGSTMGLAPLFYFGREVKLAGNRTYQDWTIQIINDEDFVIRNAFEQWFNALNDPVGNIRNSAALTLDGGYGVDAVVNQYGKTGDTIKTYNFVGIFPLDISPIDLDWGANDTIEEWTATLAVNYYGDATLSNLSQ
jgi:hypothetical protein